MARKVLNRVLFGGAGGANWPAELGLLLLRLWTGLALAIGHGWGKLQSADRFISSLDGYGVPLPTASAWFAALGEFLGGILLALGLLTRPAAFWIMCVMLGAATTAHRGSFSGDAPFFGPTPGAVEPALMYLAIALCFLLAGSGRTGVDRLLRK